MPRAPAACARQAAAVRRDPGALLQCGFKGGGEQRIASQYRRGLPIDLVVGRLSPAQIIVIHAGQVVMDQGIRVDHLHRAGEWQGLCNISPTHPADLQCEEGTDALSAGHQTVLHGVIDIGHRLPARKARLQRTFNQGLSVT